MRSQKEVRPLRGFLVRFCLATLVTISLLGATALFVRTSAANRLEKLAYEFLAQLWTRESRSKLPIIVVDIGSIPGGKDGPTPRAQLKEIIQAIAESRPKAIGVDIDFSPGPTGWKVDDDPEFLDFCLSVKNDMSVPVFLAVYEAQSAPADTWLGLHKYKDMAAASPVDPNDTRRLSRWIQAKDVPDRLQTLSSALATSYAPSLPTPYRWLARTVEVSRENTHGIERQGEDEMLFGLALVNYTKLDQIRSETLTTISEKSIGEAREQFAGRMVLLGDATHSEDSFAVPGYNVPVPGVYLLACAAYTLAVEPLFEFNSHARIFLDLLIAIVLFFATEIIRLLYVNKLPGPRFHRAQGRFIAIAIVSIFFLGGLIISWLHIMWFDFPLVIFTALLHPRVEQSVSRFGKKLIAAFG